MGTGKTGEHDPFCVHLQTPGFDTFVFINNIITSTGILHDDGNWGEPERFSMMLVVITINVVIVALYQNIVHP